MIHEDYALSPSCPRLWGDYCDTHSYWWSYWRSSRWGVCHALPRMLTRESALRMQLNPDLIFISFPQHYHRRDDTWNYWAPSEVQRFLQIQKGCSPNNDTACLMQVETKNKCNRKTQPTIFTICHLPSIIYHLPSTIYQHHHIVQCYRRDEINPYGWAEHDKVYHVFALLWGWHRRHTPSFVNFPFLQYDYFLFLRQNGFHLEFPGGINGQMDKSILLTCRILHLTSYILQHTQLVIYSYSWAWA